MDDWLSYRPSDFLMFSPRVYWRLFESLNEAWWPAQPALVAAGLAWLVICRRGATGDRDAALRIAALALAACWGLSAWAFLLERFAPVNLAARGFAAAFLLQALGLFVLALGERSLQAKSTGAGAGMAFLLGLWALLGHPFLAAASGRPWLQAEVFGLAPDPIVIGTLSFLLLAGGGPVIRRWLIRALWIVPVSWCVVSALTLATLGSAQALVPLLAGALAIASAMRR
ncbi:MAG: DUF6064 family protein [Gammaproteobacteria bacterium]